MSWIKLHRKFIHWEWFTDVNTCHLFQYCLLRANFEPTKWRGILLNRGQFISSLDSLSVATGLSVQSIRTSLKKLISTNEITSESTSQYTTITIVKYEEYQEKDEESTNEITSESTDEQQSNNKPATNHQQTINKPSTTVKEIKEIKEIKKEERERYQKISLEELSVDHIREWLARKRMEGKYLDYDEYHILEVFKNYCESKGVKYDNYPAALRNAFEWKQFKESGNTNGGRNQKDNTNRDRIMSAIFNA